MFTYGFLEPPTGFVSQNDIVSVFVMCDGEILLLQRHPDKKQGDTRGCPAGKFNTSIDKTILDTAIRELQEET